MGEAEENRYLEEIHKLKGEIANLTEKNQILKAIGRTERPYFWDVREYF